MIVTSLEKCDYRINHNITTDELFDKITDEVLTINLHNIQINKNSWFEILSRLNVLREIGLDYKFVFKSDVTPYTPDYKVEEDNKRLKIEYELFMDSKRQMLNKFGIDILVEIVDIEKGAVDIIIRELESNIIGETREFILSIGY